MADAKKEDPELWEEVKEELKESDKGGEPGQWSARKAQLAVQEYKKRGGTYADEGPDKEDTDLHEWTEEDWGTESGKKSENTGERYLPYKVRMVLTEEEYRRSTEKKQSDSHRGNEEQFSDQPDDVEDKVSQIKNGGPTKDMLMERAQELEITGRSDMTKDELLDAIKDATDENGRAKEGSRAFLSALTKDDLYDLAQDRDIDGRSNMDKDALIDALAEAKGD